MIIVSFLKGVYPLKYSGNACLSYLDNHLDVLPTPVNKVSSQIYKAVTINISL